MWVYVPNCEPCPSVPVVQGSKKASDWPFPALERCAGLSGKPSARQSWYRAWKRDSWLRRLCGQISEPSTASRGVERWISSLRGIPASRSRRPDLDVARTIHGTCGPTFIELSKRYVLPSSFWRMSEGMLDLGLEPSSEISKAQATELRRLSLQRRKWAQATSGNGCSSSEWATATGHPRTHSPRNVDHGEQLANQVDQWQTPASDSFRSRGGDRKDEMGMDQEARHWKTPHGMANEDKTGKKGGAGGGEFAKQANQWGTPGVHNSPDASPNSSRESDLREQVKMWATPNHHDARRPTDPHSTQGKNLQRDAEIWPTARAEDSESAGRRHSRDVDDTLTAKCRSFPLAPVSGSNGPESSKPTPNSRRHSASKKNNDSVGSGSPRTGERLLQRRLNPLFARHLMGWPSSEPLDGTGSEHLETAWCQYRQRMRFHYSRLVYSVKASKAA